MIYLSYTKPLDQSKKNQDRNPMSSYHKRMKTMILFLVLISLHTQAAQVLKCLGTEEAYIHKQKIGGAFKILNQDIIGEFLQLDSDIQLKTELLNRICDKRTLFPSLIILEKSILSVNSKEKIFKQKNDSTTRNGSNRQAIKNFNQSMFNIFLKFIARLQSSVDDPKCFQKNFPQIKNFYDQSRYVLEEQGQKRILQDFTHLPNLFNQIRSGSWKEGCSKKS